MFIWWQAAIMGVVQGITEFLPISSTAHLMLTAQLLDIPQTDFSKSFEIIIQFGSILAVLSLYFKKIFNWEAIKKLFVAFLPTAIIGLGLYKIVKTYLLGNSVIAAWALLVGGILIIIFEYRYRSNNKEGIDSLSKLSYAKCLVIGIFQSLAIVPGVSRSAATIIGGLGLGLKRSFIAEFSFLLAIPTMAAATGLDLLKSADSFSKDDLGVLLVGFVVSYFVAILVIKWLVSYLRRFDFIPFGVYRVIIGLLLLLYLF